MNQNIQILVPGHVYEIKNVDGEGTQKIFFVRRRDQDGDPLEYVKRIQGLLTQDLLRVAIDRTLYLYAEAPCNEDTEIIECLRRALVLYESRAARRHIEKISKPENRNTCPLCHHIYCDHQKGD